MSLWPALQAQEPGAKAPVIVAGKDQGEVDNDYLLIPVNILDHEGPLGAAFPVENRLLPQSAVSCTASAARADVWSCQPVHHANMHACIQVVLLRTNGQSDAFCQ